MSYVSLEVAQHDEPWTRDLTDVQEKSGKRRSGASVLGAFWEVPLNSHIIIDDLKKYQGHRITIVFVHTVNTNFRTIFADNKQIINSAKADSFVILIMSI